MADAGAEANRRVVTDRKKIGQYYGIGMTLAGAVATFAAIAKGAGRTREGAYGPLDIDLFAYGDGMIPGYNTVPGDPYSILVKNPATGEEEIVGTIRGIRFKEFADEAKYLYDLLGDPEWGLPPGGKLMLIGHAFKAGRHLKSSQASLRGFNFWGRKAAKGTDQPYFAGRGEEYIAGEEVVESSVKWMWWESPEDSIRSFLSYLSKWPEAKAEIYRKDADPYEYAWGLYRGSTPAGVSYGTGLNRPGGTFTFGRDMASNARQAARALKNQWGYVVDPKYIDLDVLTNQDVLCELIHGRENGSLPGDVETFDPESFMEFVAEKWHQNLTPEPC